MCYATKASRKKKRQNHEDKKTKYRIDKMYIFNNVIENGGWALRNISIGNTNCSNIEHAIINKVKNSIMRSLLNG